MDYDETTIAHEELMSELEMLRKRVVEEDARCLQLEKERAKATINALLEREALMRRMVALQEHNRRLEDSSTTLNKDLFQDILVMKETIKEYEKALQKDDPIIAQVYPYEPVIKDNVVSKIVEPTNKVTDKGKQKVVSI